MTRIGVGLTAFVAGVAGLGFASSVPLNLALLAIGVLLVIQGVYLSYYLPNVHLDKTLKRWLQRHYFHAIDDRMPSAQPDAFHFALWMSDEAGRKVMISREREAKGVLGFTAPVELDEETVRGIATKLSATQQQRLYEELHVLLATMNLAFRSRKFTSITVQGMLPVDDQVTEHTVSLKAVEVVNGVIAARSVIRKAVL